MRLLREVYLPLDGLEAMRLVDLEGLDQAEAAGRMGVSRQTLGRTLAVARRNVTQALIEGLALRIEDEAHHRVAEYAPDTDPDTDDEYRAPTATGDETIAKEMSMKFAVSTTGTTLDSPVDPHFGRAAGFLVVDPDTLSVDFIPNNGAETLSHGAGIASAELVAKAGANVVLTGSVGPKAFRALCSAGLKIGHKIDGMTVREAIEAFRCGDVEIAERPSSAGHTQ
jgi:predicted Fe-Mo cluster-binding NifX family protein/predicted DNA-binding protein (UPF0251 family)